MNRHPYTLPLMCLVLIASCGYLRVEKTFRAGADDWQMYGGEIGRTNVAHSRVQPPLSKLWEYNAGAGFSGYSASVVDSTLFIGTLQGEIHLVNIRTGKGLGSHDFGSAVVGTPIIDNDILYIALTRDEASLIAYNIRLAAIEWQAKIGDIETSPLLIRDRLIVATLQGKLVCLDKGSGEIIWTFEIPSTGRISAVHSSPASDGNIVVFGSDNGNLYAVGIEDGKKRWEASTGGAIMASPSVHAGNVYVGSLDRALYAFDAATGHTVWKQPLGANIYTSQAVDARHVYVGTSEGVLFCLNRNDGSIVWKFTASSLFNATPLVSGNIVYAGCTDKMLYAFNAESGKEEWQFKLNGRIKTMPIAWKQYLIVLAEDDDVVAFKGGRE